MVERALETGINFFDTADTYSGGQSEAILGEALGPGVDSDRHQGRLPIRRAAHAGRPFATAHTRVVRAESQAAQHRLH